MAVAPRALTDGDVSHLKGGPAGMSQLLQWLNNELKKPSSPLVAGVGAAPGAVAPYGAAVPGPATSAGDGARPPCSGQICVGAVPSRNGTVAIRGQPAVA